MGSGSGILLTGATGFIGGELLRRLLDRNPDSTVYCLVRARDADQLEARGRALLTWVGVVAPDDDRVVVVAGDVAKPELGLGDAYTDLAQRVNEIYHTAASTKFDLDLEDARAVNRDGASHILGFARKAAELGGFRRLHHVSTAYVAGNHAGVFVEDQGSDAPEFRNTYEQTKWEAEQILAPEGCAVPVTCYRPSIVVGDSRTGRTLHFRVLYDPVRWIYSGKIDVLPCRPEVRLDVVPVDYVCDAMLALGSQTDSAGQTYHLTCGPEGAIAIEEIVRVGVIEANLYNREAGIAPLAPPKIVSPDAPRSDDPEEREMFERLYAAGQAMMGTHVPYMVTEQLFDPTRTQAALRGTGIACPSLGDYLP
ncbi:MAG: SDR family oxidoreductase [Deltaproteobacteria bacterium]|nr:SDR family oxidoreductase [Deltaproteobacteria bacterium]